MKRLNKVLVWLLLIQFFATSTSFAQMGNTNYEVIDSRQYNYQSDLSNKNTETKSQLQQQNQLQQAQPKLSTIEKLFNQDLNSQVIKQFGYEIFENSGSSASISSVPVNYKLRIGDRVNVYFWGDTIDILSIAGNSVIQPSIDVTVDKEGNLFIPGVGLIPAKDTTVASIEQQIYSMLTSKFSGFKVKVSVYEPGNFPIMVMGNVKQPGVVNLNSSSSFLDALNQAGGVQKEGSLREIVYINGANKSKLTMDLYDLLIRGQQKNISLKEGDVILVKPIGKVIALSEGVKKPAIYEFKNGESLQSLITMAGGLLPSINAANVQLEGFDKSNNQKITKDINAAELSTIFPNDGDVLAFKSAYNFSENVVSIEGNIKHPGSFQYQKGMKLSDVLKSQDDLLAKTFIYQAVIERVYGVDKDIVTIPVSLVDFFKGLTDPELAPQDKIKVYASTQMKNIEVSGYISNPGIIPYVEGMTLKDLIAIVDFEIPSDVNYVDSKIVGNMRKVNINNLVAEVTSKNKDNQKLKTVYLYDLLTKNNNEYNLVLEAGDKALFRPVADKESLRTVKVLGYVKSPGVYKVRPGMKISDAIETAGGLNDDAYIKGLVFTRPTIYKQQQAMQEESITKMREDLAQKINQFQALDKGAAKVDAKEFAHAQEELIKISEKKYSETQGRIAINIKDDQISESDDLEIKDGDEIFIPSIPQHVNVIGEVHNQSAMAYYPNKSVKYYIENVGGFTKEAKKSDIYVVKANGTSVKAKRISSIKLDPGDTIIVPRKVGMPISWSSIIKDGFHMMVNSLSAVFMITRF
ncbi:MAG: polysaccharide biosynthesis/export protein [uncultured bacterium]|nr:MAG: polysaccharide biosynthesis/export protein [uncultured bacterium]